MMPVEFPPVKSRANALGVELWSTVLPVDKKTRAALAAQRIRDLFHQLKAEMDVELEQMKERGERGRDVKVAQGEVARRLGLPDATLSQFLHSDKGAGWQNINRIVETLGISANFFTQEGPTPHYTSYITSNEQRVERDDAQPSEAFLIWEARLAPRTYDPRKHRQRLIERQYRFGPEDAYLFTQAFELMLKERPPSEVDAASMREAEREADDLGAKRPGKGPKKRHPKG